MREKKNLFLPKTIILLLLIVLTYQQSNYIKNSNFTQSGCTPSASSTCTVTNSFSDGSWTVSAFPGGGAATTTVLVNAKTVRSQAPDPSQNAVWMVDASNTIKPICLTQTISSLPSGTYLFPYYLFVTTSNTDPTLQQPTVRITDSSSSVTIYSNILSFSKDGGQLSPQPAVRVNNFYSNAKLIICNNAVTNFGFYIRDFELIRQNDACDATTSSSQPLTDGTTACVPHAVVSNSYNCYRYKKNNDGTYECGQCDTSSTTPYLQTLATSPYKGCSQMMIPGAATYKLSADSTVVDSAGKIYLIPASCNGVTGTRPIAVPSFSAANKDITAFACRTDFSNVATWQVVNGAYIAASCDPNYLLITLVSSSQAKGCIDNTTPSLQYDPDCLSYKYYSPNYICQSCNTGYSPHNVTITGITVVDCLLDASETIPYCNLYTKADDTAGTLYYCATGQCTGGAVQIPQMGTAGSNGIGCTKLQTFPYGPFGACTVYDRITSATTYLTCVTCAGGLNPQFCKTANDWCDNNGVAGVQVTVNGVIHQCALSGFINNCIDYTALNAADKSLSGCKTCSAGYFSGTSVTGTSMCIAQPSVVSCKFYYVNGTCATCISGLPYDTVDQKCPTSAAQMIPNCKSAVYLNGVYICTSCQDGYMLDTSNATTRCNQAVMYCATYSSTKPAVCAACVSGYILFNNTCSKQSVQCTAIDSKGLCVQCAAGYKVSNGTCVQNISCTSSQYVNSQGVCQQGNATNCQSYSSPNGQCTSCKSGYTFNQNLECIQSSISCPSSTSTTKFIYNGTTCIQTDLNCLNTRNDGYCSVCNTGYYQNGGSCYLITNNQTAAAQSVDQFTNLLTDQFGYKYLLNGDGSRSYVTGPWIGLDVWVDNNGNLYIKNANGSRGYLTGLLQGRAAYQDPNGYWYANNSDGSRLYYTGPYAGKSVFVDSNGYYYSLNDDGSRYYITGPYQGKNVFLDNNGYFYGQNPNGSITYLNGPYQGKTLFQGPGDYLYTQNSDGSRSYINGPWVGQKVFVDPQGLLYTKNLTRNSITYLTGPYSGKTASYDPSGDLYIQNSDNSRTYLTGPNANKTLFADNAGFYYYLNPDGSRTYITGPYAGKIIYSDPTGYLYYELSPGTRTYINGPYVGKDVQVQPETNYLYYINPDGSRTYLTGPSAQKTIYPDSNGNQYTLNSDGSRFYITGPYTNKTVFTDNLEYLYTKNSDGSFTYLTGPNTGKIVFTDNLGTYTLNPNGSRTYLTGSNAGRIVFSDPLGNLYTNNPNGTKTYITGPNSGIIVYTSPNGYQYIKNPNGTINYLSGPNVGKTVFISPDGYEYVKNPDGTTTYLTGPNTNKTVYLDSTTGLEYIKNADGTRKYLADPTTTELPKPSAQDIIKNFVDGNANIVTSGQNSYIVYKDPTGKTYAVVADQTYPDGITFTDSTGNKYFIAKTSGAQPLPVQVGLNGNKYVINPDGTTRYLTKTNDLTNSTSSSAINSTSPSTTNSTPPTISPTNPSISSGSDPSSSLTDLNGYKYQLVNGQRKYLSGPWVGKTSYVDSVGAEYLINPDGTRFYISGPCKGYTVYQDSKGYWYDILPNSARSYATGPNTGKQLFPDQNGYLFELNFDKTRKYIDGPNAGKIVTADIDGYIYLMNSDGTATYTTGPYTGMIIQKDSQNNFYRQNPDGTKTYVTGSNAGKTSFVDSAGQSYKLNPDGSRTYLTGPYTGKTYFVDPNGNLYTLAAGGQRTYVTGQNSGNTVYVDLTGASYTQNPNGTRTYTSGQFSGQTVYADPQQYLYSLNKNGSRMYLSGPMAGKTIYVDSMGILYLLNQDGSRIYLTGALAGNTVSSNNSNQSSLTQQNATIDGTKLSFILTDDTGTFVLDPKGQRKYLSLSSSSSPSKKIYIDVSGLNYFVYTDLNGNQYTKNSDGTKSYLTGFSDNALSTYIVRTDQSGNYFQIYSDSMGNKYTVYIDSNGSKYYLDSDGSKKYLSNSSPVNSIASAVVDPNTQYKLYTDASGNFYVIYTDSQGRQYTILSDKTKKYLQDPALQSTGTIVFQDNTCEKFVLDSDGSRNYLKIDPTGQQGPNFVSYIDLNGNKYNIYTDPTGNKYTLNANGSKSYITGFTSKPGSNYKVYTDALGTEFTVYTLQNGDSYTAYQYSNNNSKFFFDINCSLQLTTSLTGNLVSTNTVSTGLSSQPSYNWFGIIFTDDSGNKYTLNSDKTWNYLSLSAGSSSSGNPAIYKDINSGYYLIYLDPTTGNRYVKNAGNSSTYLTGFPTSTIGSPFVFPDALNNTYAIYSDSQGNKYVTYNDMKGRYYLNPNGSKTYLSIAQIGTPANTINSASNQTNSGSITINNSTTTTSTSTTTPTSFSPSGYVFMDASSNKYILSNTNFQRIYLSPVSQTQSSYTYADPSNIKYTLLKDQQTNSWYYNLNSNVKQFITSSPSSTIGQPLTLTDSVGTTYTITSNPQGNKYVTYTDSNGKYYYDNNGLQTYLSKPNLSSDDGKTTSLWNLVNSLQKMLVECQGSMFK